MSDYRCIHIAGTNGKGSTANYMANILKVAGKRCGLFTSPHLLTWQERIKINGENINLPDSFEQTLYDGGYFVNTANLAKSTFQQADLDYAIIETGIGGKKDITMMFDADIAVITTVGMDHADILGPTLEDIGLQKAGIIRKSKKVYSHPQKRVVKSVIVEKAFKLRAPLTVLKNKQIKRVRVLSDYLLFDFKYKNNVYKDIKLSSIASVQAQNAALAIMVMLDEGINEGAIRKGLLTPLNGRTQVLNSRLVLDVAHNYDSLISLKQTLKHRYGNQKINVMFTAQNTKDIKKMAKVINSFAHTVFLVELDDKRFYKPKDISHLFKRPHYLSGKGNAIGKSFEYAKNRSQDAVLVVCGSFVLTGNVYQFISSV